MLVSVSRKELDELLGARHITTLVLSGDQNSTGQVVHDFVLEKVKEPWRHCALIADLNLLTKDERSDWFGKSADNRYAILGGTDNTVAQKGPVSDLVRVSDGQPSMIKITMAFDKGDLLL